MGLKFLQVGEITPYQEPGVFEQFAYMAISFLPLLIPLLIGIAVAVYIVRLVKRSERRAEVRLELERENALLQQTQIKGITEINQRLELIEAMLKEVG